MSGSKWQNYDSINHAHSFPLEKGQVGVDIFNNYIKYPFPQYKTRAATAYQDTEQLLGGWALISSISLKLFDLLGVAATIPRVVSKHFSALKPWNILLNDLKNLFIIESVIVRNAFLQQFVFFKKLNPSWHPYCLKWNVDTAHIEAQFMVNCVASGIRVEGKSKQSKELNNEVDSSLSFTKKMW